MCHAGDVTRSVTLLAEALRRYRGLGDQRFLATTMTELGQSLRVMGDYVRAEPLFHQSVDVLRVVGEQRYLIFGLLGLAEIYHRQGDLCRAVRLLCASEVQREMIGMRHAAFYGGMARALRESLRQQLTPSEFDAAYARGEAMSLDQVLAEIGAS